MSSTKKTCHKSLGKLLHRFYEPLVLLYVLDQCQGNHVPRQKDLSSSLSDASDTELRRRFLESLAYACDYEKGGDTVTAIVVSTGPLTYHIAANKASDGGRKVMTFLAQLLAQLRAVDRSVTLEKLAQQETHILQHCVSFSSDRIATYSKFLQNAFQDCQAATNDLDLQNELSLVHRNITKHLEVPINLCISCYDLMKGDSINLIREQASRSKRDGRSQDHFTELRHYLGRLAHHVQIVKVLLAGAQRFPGLVEECQFNPVLAPSSPHLPPPLRNKLNLDSIAGRMVSHDDDQLQDIRARLLQLDQVMGLEARVRKEYAEKNLKPRVHAELILLEYCYRHRETFRFFDNDRYIGVSKPACYCCSLYIRSHPGGFVQPPTHQKIWLNWLPPVNDSKSSKGDSKLEKDAHGRRMLNQMVQTIRQAVLSQIAVRTGGEGRRRQHDSVTWSTLTLLQTSIRDANHSPTRLSEVRESDNSDDSAVTVEAELSVLLQTQARLSLDDSDSDGGACID